MTARLDLFSAAPAMLKAWMTASHAAEAGTLEPDLLELVKIRSSQINGCANCLNIHLNHARKLGEEQRRLDVIAGWHDAPWFSTRERAALAWTEHLTELATRRAPDDVYAALDAEFSDREKVELTLMINVINGWNRLAVGFGLFDESLAA